MASATLLRRPSCSPRSNLRSQITSQVPVARSQVYDGPSEAVNGRCVRRKRSVLMPETIPPGTFLNLSTPLPKMLSQIVLPFALCSCFFICLFWVLYFSLIPYQAPTFSASVHAFRSNLCPRCNCTITSMEAANGISTPPASPTGTSRSTSGGCPPAARKCAESGVENLLTVRIVGTNLTAKNIQTELSEAVNNDPSLLSPWAVAVIIPAANFSSQSPVPQPPAPLAIFQIVSSQGNDSQPAVDVASTRLRELLEGSGVPRVRVLPPNFSNTDFLA